MQRILSAPFLVAVAIVAVAAMLGAPLSAGALMAAPALLGETANVAATAQAMQQLPYRRIRKDIDAFENVIATGLATAEIQREAKTLYGMTLYMSGTTFNETYIDELRLKLGSKTLWGGTVTGEDLRAMNAYKGYYDGNRQFLHVDFTQTKSKQWGGWGVGGIDLSKLPAGKLTVEVKIVGATAPALVAKGHWGPPQANNILQRLLKFEWSSSASGRKAIPLDFAGARLRRLFFFYDGTDWAASASAAAWAGNTGNGAMGAVTVSDGCQVGVHKFVCVEPGSNVGTFVHQLPDGTLVSSRMVVASAYSGGGLAFTLADGATDFVAGDGFDITVSENSDGNLQRVEVDKGDVPVWDFYCHEARQLQKQNGFAPQQLCYVVDFEVDNWADGALPTADGKVTFNVTLGASDALRIYAEVLDVPPNN